MAAPLFDLRALFDTIDTERRRQGLSWAALGRKVGVAPSTIQRYGTAGDAEADGVLAAIRWLGVSPEDYIATIDGTGTRLPAAGDGYVRVDMDAVAVANGDPRGAHGRTRTTIQHLADAAGRSGLAVASLTRLTET